MILATGGIGCVGCAVPVDNRVYDPVKNILTKRVKYIKIKLH